MNAPFDSFKFGHKSNHARIERLLSPGIPYWKKEFILSHQPRNGVGLIPLREGLATIVDEADWWNLIRFSWSCTSTKENYTFVRRTFFEDGIHKSLLLSRVLMEPGKGMVVDHINHDTLDNRRANLRVCSPSENNLNRRLAGIRADAPRLIRSTRTGLWNTSVDLEGCILRLHGCRSPDEAKRLLAIAKTALTDAGTQLAA